MINASIKTTATALPSHRPVSSPKVAIKAAQRSETKIAKSKETTHASAKTTGFDFVGIAG